jgi:hypothetical protein
MKNHKRLITVPLLIAIFLVGVPSLTPHAYGAATPCLTAFKCNIAILSPGSGAVLNKNQTVNPSFLVSFLVNNFTLDNPGTGTSTNVNTTTSGGGAHNQGHIHVFVDGAYVTIWASVDGIPLSLTPGTHTIRLDLVNDYHQEFSPGINATTTVNVINPAGSLQTNVSSAQGNASNAMNFSLGALVVSIITLILVAYVAFKPKPKSP